MGSVENEDFWLFGYGSLIWKPPPHYADVLSKKINAFRATFEAMFVGSGSEDHRGTPEAPGRVVTLIQRSFWETLDDPQRDTEGDRVWGVAYHIVPSKVKEVKEYLDLREINGYSIQYTPFHPADPSLPDLQCLVYIGMPDNPQFLGALPPQEIAETINASIGPSGENRDYLLHLEQALNELSSDSGDEHVTDLARRVRALPPPVRASSMPTPEHALKIVNSTEEQEEVEKEQ
ncbi:hypothetical protein HRR83_004493 [Exophiala dermatitidis]|nr:hypothetical protein HRR76_002120 [Exophiala dermatitidis]KAJ4549221.1 hypothetical protein HRR77_004097 [Exophiala dermatitidis]KAJ4575510.1 hypothetical protein HRR79_002430 [Exophiala dermatitidis]KAJ4597065.1 hypothetical protein HRR83_004493 [Exophiala dermatitidis]KAJ4619906.1 hypothetical protein HRR86_006620 [Exophiala dermatitidis]